MRLITRQFQDSPRKIKSLIFEFDNMYMFYDKYNKLQVRKYKTDIYPECDLLI